MSAIKRITGNEVMLATSGRRDHPFALDTVILATGYRPALGDFLDATSTALDVRG